MEFFVYIEIPTRTVSETNRRDHWRAKAVRTKKQRDLACCVAKRHIPQTLVGHVPTSIRMTRVSPRRLDQGNVAAALKAVQDGVCDALGVDDGHPDVAWMYDQKKGKPQSVEVTIKWSANYETNQS